jgi:hypothetical protein
MQQGWPLGQGKDSFLTKPCDIVLKKLSLEWFWGCIIKIMLPLQGVHPSVDAGSSRGFVDIV